MKAGLQYEGNPHEGEYFGIFLGENRDFKGLFVLYWTGTLMSLLPEEYLIEINPMDMFERKIRRVEGNREWVGHIRARANSEIKEDIMLSLDLLNFSVTFEDDLVVEIANEEDISEVTECRIEFMTESGQMNSITRKLSEKYSYEMVASSSIFVLRRKGTTDIIALLSKNVATNDTAILGFVYVTKDFRGRGYGRRLLSGVLQIFKETAIETVLLYSSNLIALQLYKSAGFQPVGNYYVSYLSNCQ